LTPLDEKGALHGDQSDRFLIRDTKKDTVSRVIFPLMGCSRRRRVET